MARNLYFFDIEMEDITPLIWAMNKRYPANADIYILRGKMMKDWDGVFAEFSAALQFPDDFLFGRNYFGECMRDLEWLNCERTFILIRDYDELFSLGEEDRATFLERIEEYIIFSRKELKRLFNKYCEMYILCQSREKGQKIRHVHDLKRMLRPLFSKRISF